MRLIGRHLGTRSSKATHDLENQASASSDRPAKRRRTETSKRDASPVELAEQQAPPDVLGSGESDDVDASLRELRAQLKVHSEEDDQNRASGLAPAESLSQLDADMTKAISDIIDHSERFEQYCATSATDDEAHSGPKSLVFAKTGSRMKVESLPILDNLVRNTFLTEPRCSG